MSSPPSTPVWVPPVIEGHEPVAGAAALADLVALDPVAGGWRNRCCVRNVGGTVLGGQLAAHCLVAAAADEAGMEPNGVQLVFVGGPDHRQPFHLTKDCLRTGRRLAHRAVRLGQADATFVHAQVTLQAPVRAAAAPACDPARPHLPPPEACVPRAVAPGETNALVIGMAGAHPFIEIRATPGYVPGDCQIDGRRAFYWFRMPDARGLPLIDHYALLTLKTDFWYTLPVHGVGSGPRPAWMTTSLDHAVWFHDRPDVSEWILVETECALIAQDIGHKRARYWTRDGRPLATVAQQSLIRSAPVAAPPAWRGQPEI